jgi:hypothetical protein
VATVKVSIGKIGISDLTYSTTARYAQITPVRTLSVIGYVILRVLWAMCRVLHISRFTLIQMRGTASASEKTGNLASHHIVALTQKGRHIKIVLLEIRRQVRKYAGAH